MNKIFVDLDNTLNDFLFKWIEYCNETFSKNYSVKDVKSWEGIFELYKNKNKILNFFNLKIYENNIVKPLQNSDLFLKELKKANREIIIITDTPERHKKEKGEWIERYFGNFIDDVIFSNKDKYKYISENDIFIDDNPHHIKTSKSKYNYLFNYKMQYDYIFEVNLDNKCKIVKDYDEILNDLQIYGDIT